MGNKKITIISIIWGILMGYIFSLISSNNRDGKNASGYLFIDAKDTICYEDNGTITFEDYLNKEKYTYIYNGEIGILHNDLLPEKGFVQTASDAALIADAYIHFTFGHFISSVSQPYLVEERDSLWYVMSKCANVHKRGCAMMTISKRDGSSEVYVK